MNSLLDRAGAAFAEFECLLDAEIMAGNTISGTPAAACGRAALSVACTVARSLMAKHSAKTVVGGAVAVRARIRPRAPLWPGDLQPSTGREI